MALEFPESLKNEAATAMEFIFNTFKRTEPLVVYFVQQEEIVVQDPSYNAYFAPSHTTTTQITKTGQSQNIDARIWYLDDQNLSTKLNGSETNAFISFLQNFGKVKIQIKQSDFDLFQGAKKIWMFDEKYRIIEEKRRVGILNSFPYIEFVLERVN